MKALKLFTTRMLITAFVSTLTLNAQQADTLKDLPNLLLPRFTAGIVRLKNGDIRKAILNYDLVGQQMVFLQRKLTLVLDDPQQVDTVFLANRIFVSFPKGFYELLMKKEDVSLFKQHKAYVEYPGMPTGYGAKSQTAAPSYVNQIYGPTGAINLKIPNDYKVIDDSQYWIKRGDEMSAFKNKRQFLKIFPDKQKELDKYITKERIDFKKVDDVRKLVEYLFSL